MTKIVFPTESQRLMLMHSDVIAEYMNLSGLNRIKSYHAPEEIEEIKNKIVEIKWQKMREKRNELLKNSDYLVSPDLWEGYTSIMKKDLTDYRQALRDLPANITNIDNIEWPIKP